MVVVVVHCFAESGRQAAIVSLDVVRQEGQGTYHWDDVVGRKNGRKEEW